MVNDESRLPVESIWRTHEGETMKIANEEIQRRARKLEREAVGFYWAAWVSIPIFLVVYARTMLRIHDPLLLAGTGLGLATLLLITGALIRHRPARISAAQPCFEFIRKTLEAKRRGASWIRRALLLGVPAVICCWMAQPGVSPVPFVSTFLGLGFCWFAFWREGKRLRRELETLGAAWRD